MVKRFLVASSAVLLIVACTSKAPTAPAPVQSAVSSTAVHAGHDATLTVHAVANPDPPGQDDKGYIHGWIDGEDVQLYYTKSYSCPPVPPVPPAVPNPNVPCELGADSDTAPRPGQMPTIYAIAAAPPIANLVDQATLACRAGTPCLNHPLMIDLSRIGGSPTAGPAAHNHILTARGGGWFHTVNIRVFSLAAWQAIAEAKTLAKVRELQGDPNVGTPGVISADTKTNIFFFIAGAR